MAWFLSILAQYTFVSVYSAASGIPDVFHVTETILLNATGWVGTALPLINDQDHFLSFSSACLGRGSFGWASFTACSAAATASALRPVAASTSASTRYPSHSSGRQPTPARAASSASGSRPSRSSAFARKRYPGA